MRQGDFSVANTQSVAPNSSAITNLSLLVSTAIIRLAPAILAP